jgi:hypothetical protein
MNFKGASTNGNKGGTSALHLKEYFEGDKNDVPDNM